MGLFSYIDTSAPSTEEIMAFETEYNEDGTVKEPSFVDKQELTTEISLQRVASLLGTLSFIWTIVGLLVTGWLTYSSIAERMSVTAKELVTTVSGSDVVRHIVTVSGASEGGFGLVAESLLVFLVGAVITFVGFGLLRLARAFANFMLVRLLQCEEPEK